MKHVVDFIANNPILLGVVILALALLAYRILKTVARIALFLLTLGLVTWLVLHWLGKI